MKDGFLEAVADTLLPGEPAGSDVACGASPLPSATQAGVTLKPKDAAQKAVLRLIAQRAGGEDAFVRASLSSRTTVLEAVESESFEAFRALVSCLLQEYYEAPSVLAAMGWREGAAQPLGHHVPEADEATLRRLDKVRGRGSLWRQSD
jgi:hypothetical protein